MVLVLANTDAGIEASDKVLSNTYTTLVDLDRTLELQSPSQWKNDSKIRFGFWNSKFIPRWTHMPRPYKEIILQFFWHDHYSIQEGKRERQVLRYKTRKECFTREALFFFIGNA